jgi:probable F420-dependent oxidoreductase
VNKPSLPIPDAVRYGLVAELRDPGHLRELVPTLESAGFHGYWTGDHIAFTTPVNDPFVQLAQVAVLSDRLTVGTSVYLAPLRPAAAAAKQAATLDLFSSGRFIFGLGVGGEFEAEFDACGVPVKERGARLTEAIEVMRLLWTGEPCHFEGKFCRLDGAQMSPTPFTSGGPPIWCGARKPVALERIGRMADGWMSYAVTPEQYAAGLERIAGVATSVGRQMDHFATSHLLFTRFAPSREEALEVATAQLSARYAMDFEGPARRYAALGTADDIAATICTFHSAGVRTFLFDFLGSPQEQLAQIEQFSREVMPRVSHL